MAVVINGTSGITGNTGTLISASTIGVGGATPSASGAGITFPATQSASTNANTLDDYEEGSWTPANATVALTGVSGRYIKIGRLVTVIAQWGYPTTASGSAAEISGLPFTVEGFGGNFGGTVTVTNYGSDNLYPCVQEGNTVILMRTNTNADIALSSVSSKFVNFMASYLTAN